MKLDRRVGVPFDQTLVPPGLVDLDLEALAHEYGTPVFVYDEDELRRRCREYVEAFGADGVAYASKAFLCVAMVRLVASEGLHLDVATGGELHVALHAGFPADRVVFHGNNKSEEELRAALRVGVGRIVADSFDELDRLERLASRHGRQRPRVLVRVTPGVEAHTHEYVETGTQASKFGFTIHEDIARSAVHRVANSEALEFAGLHCHIGSQIFTLAPFVRTIKILAAFAQVLDGDGIGVPEWNLGGGLGARYVVDDPVMDVAEYAKTIRDALAATGIADRTGARPRVMVEPGRSIVAPAAITVYRVGTVKDIPGVGTYVAVDGGMSDNPRPVLYGAGYEAYLPRRLSDPCTERCTIVGKHCEQGDVLVADAVLPGGVAPGDLLATPCTGAYGYSMASNYNKVPRPAVVFVRGGVPRLVVRRESLDDLFRLDEAPD